MSLVAGVNGTLGVDAAPDAAGRPAPPAARRSFGSVIAVEPTPPDKSRPATLPFTARVMIAMNAPQQRNTLTDAGSPQTIRIVIADDHLVVRSGVRLLLEREQDFEVLAEAGDIDTARRYIRGHHPDVLVADLNMPGGSVLAAIPELRREAPNTQIVVLTMQGEPAFARAVLSAGALAYVLKEASEAELIKAVRLAAEGRTYLDPQLGARIATEPAAGSPDELSDRELQVLQGIALGHRNNEMAAQLYISLRTIEETRRHIQQKLGLRTRPQLVRYAIARGLLDQNDQ